MRAGEVSLPEHREEGGVGQEDPERPAEHPAHLPPPNLSFGTSLNKFQVCHASSYQSGTDTRVGIFVPFAAVSPVPTACPAHSRCSVNTGGMHSCSLPSGSLPTLFPLPGTPSLTLRNPAHSYCLFSFGFFRKAVPEPSKPGSIANQPLLTAPCTAPGMALAKLFYNRPFACLSNILAHLPLKTPTLSSPPSPLRDRQTEAQRG